MGEGWEQLGRPVGSFGQEAAHVVNIQYLAPIACGLRGNSGNWLGYSCHYEVKTVWFSRGRNGKIVATFGRRKETVWERFAVLIERFAGNCSRKMRVK